MGTVTLLQASNIRELPIALAGGHGAGDENELSVIGSDPEDGWFSCSVVFEQGENPSAVASSAYLDTGDEGIGPNARFTGFSTFITYGMTQTAFDDGDLDRIVEEFLEGNDTIVGSPGADTIGACEGADIVRGGGGFDDIEGNEGADRLFGDGVGDLIGGGTGRDLIVGGPGADTLYPNDTLDLTIDDQTRDIFRYTKLSDSGPTPATRDSIYGFMRGADPRDDRIDLSPIDANPSVPGNQRFTLVNAFTAAKGELRLVVSGGNTLVQVDGDNDPAVDLTILVAGVTGLRAWDFIL